MSVGDAKSEIAASRAIYFRDLQQATEGGEVSGQTNNRAKRPSYVGISNSLNGYTPYASYRTDTGRRISPPLHLPLQRQRDLDSVALVLSQDGFQKSLAEFQETMRDITMGRPESSDITDNARILNVQDEFFPTSHMKEVIKDGEARSVTTITQFHSSNGTSPSSAVKKTPNLVSKQIERLYGGDPFAQIRLTSPEHQARHPDDEIYNSPANGNKNGTSPERKLSPSSGGGFFAKRFGITKMKDHSTLKSGDDLPGEIKPLKVPAVFKLLRPEFREQLKQSSCKISMPDEEGQGRERVIPILREGRSPPPVSPHASSRQVADPATPSGRPSAERIIPISRLNGGSASSITSKHMNGTPMAKSASSNGVTSPVNGSSAYNNNNGSVYSNGRPASTPPPLVNGSSATNGVSPSNGVIRRSVPTVIGFRNPIQQSATNGSLAATEKVNINGDKDSSHSTAASVTVPAKPLIIRKLSPLSPKHIVVPTSNAGGVASKPAPAPKPEHLMSPPLSPVPSDGGRGSPASSRTGSVASPCPPEEVKEVEVEVKKEKETDIPDIKKLSITEDIKKETPVNGDSQDSDEVDRVSQDSLPVKQLDSMPVKQHDSLPVKQEEKVNGHDYEMESDYLQYNGDQYTPQYYGLRERELLHPILEEDNESTASASGSLLNLQQAASTNNINNAATTSGYASDDPLLLTEQGEVQDGHYFIKVLENEIFKFEEQICDFEEELGMSPDIPEECRENILSTVGLAKLLMAQKLTQFRGLCDKNINVSVEEDPFVPTSGDLAGFWDMVHIQVEQVHNRFAELQKLRSQGWKEVKVVAKPKAKKPMNKSVNKPIKPKEKSEAAKARDEARKKMMEAKKKMMKENKENKENSDLIIIM